MSLAFVGITLNIRNNRDYPIRINVLGSPFNPLDTANANTEYRWDITAFSPSSNDILTLEYKPVGASVFSTFTYEITNTNIEGLINALDALGIGYFQSYTELGQLYLSTYNDNNIFGLLTITSSGGGGGTSTTTTTTTAAPTTSTTTTTTTLVPPTSTTTTTTTAAPTTSTTTTTTTLVPPTSTTTTTTTAAPTTSTTTTTTTLVPPTSTTTTTTTAAPTTSTTTTSTTAAPTSTTTTTTTAAPTTSTTTTTTTAAPTSTTTTTTTAAPTTSTTTTTTTTNITFSIGANTYNGGSSYTGYASNSLSCSAASVGSPPLATVFTNTIIGDGVILYLDSSLTQPIVSTGGYYWASGGIGNYYYFTIGGSGEVIGFTSCTVPTTTSTTTTTTAAPTTSTTTTTTTAAPASFSLGYSTLNPNDACAASQSTYYATNGSVVGNGTVIYTDANLTTLASNGFYSDAVNSYVVNTGNGTLTGQSACGLTTTTTSTTTSTTTAAPVYSFCLGYDASSQSAACADYSNCGATYVTLNWNVGKQSGGQLIVYNNASVELLNITSSAGSAQSGTIFPLVSELPYTIRGQWVSGSGNIIQYNLCDLVGGGTIFSSSPITNIIGYEDYLASPTPVDALVQLTANNVTPPTCPV